MGKLALLPFSLIPFVVVAAARAETLAERLVAVQQQAKAFTAQTVRCSKPIRFEVDDFLFQKDELEQFSLWGVEQGQILSRLLGEACARLPTNRDILAGVGVVHFRRGSLEDRKLVRLKTGDLAYFAASDSKQASRNWDDILRDDLIRVLKLDFKSAPITASAAAASAAPAGASSADQKKEKIAAAQAWYADEMKRLMAKPPVDPKDIERLTQAYKEKLDAALKQD